MGWQAVAICATITDGRGGGWNHDRVLMVYRYDVFISYRREPLWTPWAREHVKPLMASYLQQDLGCRAEIFMDERIGPGAQIPRELAEGIAYSRVMVPLFSLDYFGSEWCLHELDLMHQRLQAFPDKTLIIPVLVHDGDAIPVELRTLQRCDFKPFRLTHLCKDSPLYQGFSDAMRLLAPRIAQAIQSAPQPDPAWMAACESRFNAVFQAEQAGTQLKLQSLTRMPLPTATTVPRPRP